ncbi:MAG: efflux RND transporter periplasmic adaptor subunit [Bacteroidales bacterium]
MRRVDRRIVIIISVIFILALAYGLMRFLILQREPPPVRRPVQAKRLVRVEPVKYATIPSEVSGPGRLSSLAEIDLVAEASGKIEAGEVALKKGGTFSRGDVLFVIYPDEAILSLKARKSQYLNTLAGILPDLAVDFPDHEKHFTRFFSSISIEEPLPSFPAVTNDKLKIFLASRNVIGEYYNIQRDELQLERRTLIAPFDGTYREVYMELGAYTNTGGRVARAIRTDELELEVPLERADAARIKIGDPVTITSEKRSLSWNGTVIRKSPFVDENTQSREIFVHVQNHSAQPLLTGEYLNAVFPVRPIDGVMEIPRNAVFNTNEVFLVEKGRLTKDEVNIVKVNQRTLIFNGLNEGDSLVVQQLINVSEGTIVSPSGERTRKSGEGR